MEIKKSFCVRNVFVGLYSLAFLVFLMVGFMPAEVKAYDEDYGELVIPSINFSSEVAMVEKDEDELKVPDEIVGRYSKYKNKTLLVGHSSTVFGDLKNVRVGDTVTYDDNIYAVSDIETILTEVRQC